MGARSSPSLTLGPISTKRLQVSRARSGSPVLLRLGELLLPVPVTCDVERGKKSLIWLSPTNGLTGPVQRRADIPDLLGQSGLAAWRSLRGTAGDTDDGGAGNIYRCFSSRCRSPSWPRATHSRRHDPVCCAAAVRFRTWNRHADLVALIFIRAFRPRPADRRNGNRIHGHRYSGQAFSEALENIDRKQVEGNWPRRVPEGPDIPLRRDSPDSPDRPRLADPLLSGIEYPFGDCDRRAWRWRYRPDACRDHSHLT